MMINAQKKIAKLLELAGVELNGSRAWDMQVHDDRVYSRLLAKGSVGLGESYTDRWWSTSRLDEFFRRIIDSRIEEYMQWNIPSLWLLLKSYLLNMQTISRSQKVAVEHYDLGNDLYMSFLDPYNQYTCAYFKNTTDLNKAQEQKLELICQKLMLSEEDHVLDIGCGWGGFCKYATEHFGCKVTGISISDEQVSYARNYCEGLNVEIVKSDYRKINGSYDKVLICGMIEHVGYKNYPVIMKKVNELLSERGLFLLHTIGTDSSKCATDPWISKYIFPNSMIPSVCQLSTAFEGLFVMEDWHNFGHYYADTLRAWMHNFKNNWSGLKDKYGEPFFRKWEYYLMSSTAYFDSRVGQLWQIVFSKNGVKGGYPIFR